MNFDAHIAKWSPNKHIELYGGECVANAATYCLENGKPIAYANAKDWWMNPALTGSFDFITNNPSDLKQVPLRGDIIIWSGNLPGSGGFGHIGIFDAIVSPGIFRSFDQNWGGNYCHFVTHNYGYIIGWMRPKATTPQGDEMFRTDAEIQEFYYMLRGANATAPEVAGWRGKSMLQFVLTAKPEVANREKARVDALKRLSDLQTAINAQNKVITDLTASSNTTKAQYQEAIGKLADLNAQLATAHDQIKDLQTKPAQDTQLLNDTGNIFARLFNRLFKKG